MSRSAAIVSGAEELNKHLFSGREDDEDAMMKTSLRLAALAAMALVSLPAYADMTVKSSDGSVELALPNGWHDVKPEGDSTKIAATDGHGTRIVVRVYPKEDFKDAKAVADFAVKKLKLADNEGVKSEDIQIGGKPAVRMSIVGTRVNQKRAGFLITILDADSQYIEVQGATDASSFAKQTPVLQALASGPENCARHRPPRKRPRLPRQRRRNPRSSRLCRNNRVEILTGRRTSVDSGRPPPSGRLD